MVIFILVNYVTHAMTVKPLPGEKSMSIALYQFIALLFPFTGAWRGLRAIKLAARYGEDDLQRALRAGALCVVARTVDWRVQSGEEIAGCALRGAKLVDSVSNLPMAHISVDSCKDLTPKPIRQAEVYIHGQCLLPHGYHLVRLPENVRVDRVHDEPVNIRTTQNSAKVIISMVQLLFASFTLYRARGDQLDRYGYAAFALTVIPYGIMSLVNFIGNLCTPDYLSIYVVQTDVTVGTVHVDQMEKPVDETTIYFETAADDAGMTYYREGKADYTYGDGSPEILVPSVGRLYKREPCPYQKTRDFIVYFLAALAWVAPYAIIACLTKFEPRSSTDSQRLWTISWLVVGQVAGALMAGITTGIDGFSGRVTLFFCSAVFVLPAFGGFITVVSMMREFGKCIAV
jgi:hypothetical protein